VLRAESSLNSLVSHPLPAQFYDGGGMQALRDKFRQEKKSSRGGDLDGEVVEEIADESKSRASYFTSVPGARDRRSSGSFGQAPSSANINSLNLAVDSISTSPVFNTAPLPTPSSQPPTPAAAPSAPRPLRPLAPPSPQMYRRTPTAMAPGFRRGNTRKNVQAGDLLSMTDSGEAAYRPQSYAPVTPRPLAWDQPRRSNTIKQQQPLQTSMESALPDFNLRDAVMESLAKSIGLIQPPPSLPDSASASTYAPSLNGSTMLHSPSSYTPFSQSASSYASFGAGLSMLERLGDEGSTTGGSGSGWAAGSGTGEAMEELENEVEILFFPKGGQLVKEGEKNAGWSLASRL
jgi:lysophospholipid hydrolase